MFIGMFNEFGQIIYVLVDVWLKGVELEVIGKFGDNFDLVVGYMVLKMDGFDGSYIYLWVLWCMVNLLLSVYLLFYCVIFLGVGGCWQSVIFNIESSGFIVCQGSYVVFNGFVVWQFFFDVMVCLNVCNFGNEKYINMLCYSGFYGVLCSYMVSLDWWF